MESNSRRDVLKKSGIALASSSALAVLGSGSAVAAGSDYELIVGSKSGYSAYLIHVPKASSETAVFGTEFTEEDSADSIDAIEDGGDYYEIYGGVSTGDDDSDPTNGDKWLVRSGGSYEGIDTDDVTVSTNPL
ncbi:hypothetical protein [Halorussus lipolyticus]|uniref:hypothetical protein n=1 Tax=Halorussus lipolyticus TaxID=3034024 RepID=UPI0023E85F60|nr:hypothetical protein [Halorussus sp. DT80]